MSTLPPRRPRILHVFKTAAPEYIGGVPAIMETIVSGLGDRFDSGLLISSNRPASEFESHLGLPVTTVRHFGHFMSMPVAPTLPLRLGLMASHYDMVVLHMPFPLADLASYMDFPRSVPLVVQWHSAIVRQTMFKPLYSRPMRRSLQKARAIVVSGLPLVETAKPLRQVRDKCHAIPFGIDADAWNRLSAADLSEIERIRNAHPRLILAVGRLVSYKGFHILAEALRTLDAEAWIVGDGPLDGLIRKRAAEAGTGGRLRLLGRVPAATLKRLYHAARVLAFPSITDAETFGLVQVEAMACGLPVVNTRLNTMVPHVARHELEALTVPPHDAGALAAALHQILDQPALAQRLGRAGAARVASTYGLDRFLDATAALYERVLREARDMAT
ncbi:MAG: glycosyltransferase [Xanthobacteraceae bacterium]|nr:glycosyltransferase [Xanthobacteraceae bacterium]